jgi:hypothetical protein
MQVSGVFCKERVDEKAQWLAGMVFSDWNMIEF